MNGIEINAQCTAYTANIHCTTAAPTIIGNSITCTPPTNNGGRRNFLVTNMIAGNVYRVSNCGSGFDTQLTIFNAAGTASLAYNDDDGPGCAGSAASIDFVPPATGDYRMQLNRFNCSTTNQLNGTITVTLIGAAPPAPSNDLCSNATPLPCGTSNLAGTTVGTTNIANVSGCSMSNYGVWYTFVGDGQQTTITTNPSFDIKLSVSTGTCGSMTNIVCTDTAPETATFTTVNGVTYYVYVAHWLAGSTTTGTFTISRTCSPAPTPPANDLCSNATPLPCGTTNLAGTTVNTTNIANVSGCSMSNYGVWYTFVGDGNVTTITTNPSFDIKLSVATGTCGSLTNIACTDAFPETATFSTINGTTYYVYIAHWLSGSTTTGTFTISRSCTPPIGNDDCLNAVNLTVNPTTTCTSTTAGSTFGASQSLAGCVGGADDDVWFSFVATSTIHNVTVTPGSLSDAVLQVFSGSCGTLSSLDCVDDTITGNESSVITGLTVGNTYFVRVYSYANGSGQGTFTMCVTTPPNPCLTVTNIATCGSTINLTVPSGIGSYPNSPCGWTTPGIESIYTFTPTQSGTYTIQQLNSYTTIDYHYKAVSDGCNNIGWSCVDDLFGASTSSSFFLSAGIQYYFLLDPENSAGGNVSFIINCTTNPCTNGSGTGTSALACPSVLSGGLGLNGADPIPLDCNSVSTCVDLEATYLQLGDTSSYTVESITYAPPYQFDCLQNPVSVNIDDIWSPVINIPFDFCFYGNTYNSCIMGSNGMISFDTTNASSPSGYAFSDNLPSLVGALFPNTIYGVYHDIDPSVGGTVGWELITLNTGCRALVASWNDIPMFSSVCNSILYTGMIVLYEDTNVIEVYIKEKNVCATWNGGNAIVGIQDETGTQAVVAPGRNGLDADWTVTNEAWRFVPSGPSITSIQWYEGSGTSGPVIGNTDVINVCPTVTTTYTAQVTYALCNGSTIVENDETIVTVIGDKTWNGSIDSDWNKNNNWTPVGIPNNTDCVLIPITPNDPIISGTNYNGLAGTLRILNNATLTVNSNNSITVTDWVNVQPNGTFDIQDNSSLVQINNTANVGNIIYRRDTDIRRLDYVYWSSPVAGFNVSNIPAPITPGPIFTWNPTFANPNGGQGYWIGAAGSTMQPAVGYIMRGPNSFGNTPTTLNGSFTGVPNNGQITTSISRGSDTNTATHYGLNGTEITNLSDNYNLIGNPYPSAIRASQFLYNNNTKIEGNVRLWTHGTLPAAITSPFYDTYAYNYTPGDYYIFNFTGASCCPAAGSDLFIGAGQGFFVQMIDGPPASDFVSFDNGLRNPSYDNSLFYRNAYQIETESNLTNLERHRMWFDIINSDGLNDRTLIGYIENATMGRDSFFDANTAVAGNMIIYSLLDEEKLTIQGRSLPFDVNDIVPIGVYIPSGGQYTIALAAIDGLFENQIIYLKDKLTNIFHNIKENPYSFYSEQGTFNNRFEVVYQNETLNNPDFSLENIIRVTSNENLIVHSSSELMESVLVYNVLGQKLAEYKNVNANQLILSDLQKNNSTLLLKIKLQNTTTSIEKVIY
ncbi:hypothetical protein EQG68_06495 [Flavobacterium piscinae]|uniref:T9SS-like galactose binding domain-containing protein n=1 Tax=Flavobacterium piscinae TaxID=2506424 RepID=A0A4Q1KSJ2_9FLAO|nr:hypothetical protein [Flavobacterium piscinae]RXR33133.1 hypothetical protein EQG68_06495 [Flavobacterium piscinae]